MGKSNNIEDKTRRKKGKDNKKNTFKKYGKNTQRGMRIKQAELEKKAAKRKQEGDHSFIKWKQKCDSKGKNGGKGGGKSMCKITCKNKKR